MNKLQIITLAQLRRIPNVKRLQDMLPDLNAPQAVNPLPNPHMAKFHASREARAAEEEFQGGHNHD